MRIGSYETHPACELFPLMTGPDLDALARDIREKGLRTSIVLCDGQVLDGRNRLLACQRAGVEPRFEEWRPCGSSPLAWLVSMNLHRRHLTSGQRALIAARLAEGFAADARRRRGTRTDLGAALSNDDRGKATAKAGALVHVSARSVEHARAVLQHGMPALVHAVRNGDVSVSAAAGIARAPADEQQSAVAQLGRHAQRLSPVANRRSGAEESKGTFGIIAAFPDWSSQPQFERLRRFRVDTIAAGSATAFLWTPSAMLPKALTVLAWWGFEYAASVVCIRATSADGAFTRERHEFVLVGTSGASPPRPAPRDLPDSVQEVGDLDAAGSRKAIAQKLAQLYPSASRVEIFAPDTLPGWASAP